MKIIKFGIALLTFALLASCGGGNSSEEKISLPDPPTDIKYSGISLIDGPLSGYVEVVPGDYFLELEKQEDKFLLGYSGIMKVKFKFLKPIEVIAGQGYNRFGPSLLGKALDEQGIPLEFNLDIDTDKDLATYLERGSGEEWITLRINGQGSCKNAEEAAELLLKYKQGRKIRFNSEIVEEEFDSENSTNSSSVSESSEASSSSNDCDDFLDGYEKFMEDYIAIIKKMKSNPNDMSVMADYTSMMTEASEWAGQPADCTGDLEFVARFTEIQLKVANAASGL